MEKINHSQLELFSQPSNRYQAKTGYRSRSFFNNIKNYEKIIMVGIGFIIIGIISFTSGVEKGKKMASARNDPHPNIALSEPSNRNQPILKKYDADKPFTAASQPMAIAPQKAAGAKNFTVQVATYRSQTFAQKEAGSLKNKGLLPLLLSKGGFTILCVGKFADKENARPLLSQLKNRYPDCRIRRL